MRPPLLRPLGLVLALSGCHAVTSVGTSAMEFLDPISEPAPQTDRVLNFAAGVAAEAIPPEAEGELTKPAYPPVALMDHPRTYLINVTVTIDTQGRVSEVEPSWNRLNPPGPYSDDLLAAVRAAAVSWRFIPAKHVYWRLNAAGEAIYDHADAVVCQTDLRFTFEPRSP